MFHDLINADHNLRGAAVQSPNYLLKYMCIILIFVCFLPLKSAMKISESSLSTVIPLIRIDYINLNMLCAA